MPKAYSGEFKQGAVALARQGERPVREIAQELGVAESCLRCWLKQDQVDHREREDAISTGEREELRALGRENVRLKQEKGDSAKSSRLLRPGGGPVSRYRLIAAEKDHHSISWMCWLLGVSRSGYHAWVRRALSDRALSDAWLIERIGQIDADNRGVYGAPARPC